MTPLGQTSVHDVWSDAVEDTFRVFVAECGESPEAVLFLTDANGLFGLTVDTIRLMQIPGLLPSMLVVGVGYPIAGTLIDTVHFRARDLTPSAMPNFAKSGGADRFIEFIQADLWPRLAADYPTACDSSIYFGHSLGGLFGAYAMLTDSGTCDRYILSSPSLWWDNYQVLAMAEQQAQASSFATAVVMGIGSLETDAGRRVEAANLPEGHPMKPPGAHLDMVADARQFATLLRKCEGLDLMSIEVADEFHSTVPAIVLSRALRHFFA